MKRDIIFPLTFGILLILCGGIWLGTNLFPELGQVVNFALLWPLFLLVPGLLFWGMFLLSSNHKKDWGILIPANILTFISLTFFFNILVSETLGYNSVWAWTAFMYPGSVAIAFWTAWLFADREPGLLIPAVILSTISLMIMCGTTILVLFADQGMNGLGGILFPLIVILVGLLIISSPIWQNAFDDKNRRVAGKTESEWEAWGENFGKNIEQGVNKMFGQAERNVEEGEVVSEGDKVQGARTEL